MIKLPSLFSLWQNFRNVLFRFPLQALISLLAMSLWIWVSHQNNDQHADQVHKLIALCNLAFTLSLAVNLFAEFNKWAQAKNFALQMLTILFCGLLFFLLSPHLFKADLLRLILFVLSGHLAVSFSVYYSSIKVLEFWHFNKVLFLRFLTAVLFSIVLFAGLSVALLTIDALFNYEIAGKVYFRLFIVVAVGFSSIFFLAGIPDERNNSTSNIRLSHEEYYPKVLKVFTQYVLIPLLTIYFGILVVYELKIAINAQLPDGMVSILILGYAFFGILSYLLIYPISKDSGNEWMRQFSILFFWLMAPLLILLFIAIWVRVEEYGLTEMRYFIILMAIWLSGITLYFVIRKSPSIQLIPISLFALVLLSTYGPQSAANLSKVSQQSRLHHYINKTDAKALEEKISIINYLVDFHGLVALQEYSNANLKDIQREVIWSADSLNAGSYKVTSKLKDTAFSILSVDRSSYPSNRQYYTFFNKEKLIPIEESDYIYWLQGDLKQEFDSSLGKISINSNANQSLLIKIGEIDSVDFDILLFKDKLLQQYKSLESKSDTNGIKEIVEDPGIHLPEEWMSLRETSPNYRVELKLQRISVQKSNEKIESVYIPSLTGYLMIVRK